MPHPIQRQLLGKIGFSPILHSSPWLNLKISSKVLSLSPAVLNFHELEGKYQRKITSFTGQQLTLGESEPSCGA